MVNVAIIGFGIVGTGTAEVLHRMKQSKTRRKQESVNLKYILVRRDFPESPYKDLMVKDFNKITEDPQVHIVIETMGGITAAYDMTKQALSQGKSVVTSNKELVATHGSELLALAKENNCNYLFEAAVGGGIPLLNPLNNCLKSNDILEIAGILNGTCNYILTNMEDDGTQSFEEVLKAAQDLGFAEQDPSADVDGHDTCRKIAILANMICGSQIDPTAVSTEGIRNISLKDMQYTSSDYTIKLVGRALFDKEGSHYVYVAPHFIHNGSDQKGNPLYNVKGVQNAVVVKGDSVGSTVFGGPGAGSLPTASAVMADVYDLAQDYLHNAYHSRNNIWDSTPVPLGNMDTLPDDFYVRFDLDLKSVEGHSQLKSLQTEILSPNLSTSEETEKWHSHTTALLVHGVTKTDLTQALKGLPVGNILRVFPK